MAKRYFKIGFEDAPSTKTPVDSVNLGKMDTGIDELDTWRDSLIVDNVASTLTDKALSANQGKLLNDKVTTLNESLNAKVLSNITGGLSGTADFNTYTQYGRYTGSGYYSNMQNLPPVLTGATAAQFELDVSLVVNKIVQKLVAIDEATNLINVFYRASNISTINFGAWVAL